MLRGLKQCSVYTGHARFRSAHEVEVGDTVLRAERIFVNVGGRASVPPMPGVDRVPYLTNSSMMNLDVAPEHLVIVGGSYVGLEFGQMFRRFGSAVTIIEMASRLVQREDEDVSASIHDDADERRHRGAPECALHQPRRRQRTRDGRGRLRRRAVQRSRDRTCCSPSAAAPTPRISGSTRPAWRRDERGYIVVDDQLQTNVPGIWALGDCNGKGAFTHTAYNDFEIVAANLLDGASRRVSDRIPAYALYIDPPLGRAGLTESEARRAGHSVLVGTRPMSRVGRAVEKGETSRRDEDHRRREVARRFSAPRCSEPAATR